MRDPFRIRRLSNEGLWQQVGGWDYLTEENAPRSIGYLHGLIAQTIDLVERISLAAQVTDSRRHT